MPVMEEHVPDPVEEAHEYQRFILGYLGDRDPLEVQEGTADALQGLVREAGDRLTTRPEPKEWSVLECMGHFVGAEIVLTARYRWIVAQDEPELVPYDQDLWVDRLHMNDQAPEALLGLFRALREANLDMWRRSTPEERARIGMHAERGPESYELCFRLLAGHDRFHLDQTRRTLEQVRG